MGKIEITQEAFDAYEKDAQINYLDKIRIQLGDENIVFKIGDDIIRDREELQDWQIEKGYIQ